MRIVIDLQGAQGASRHRGIGRYSLSFSTAFISLAARAGHEVLVALNGMFPDQVDRLRDALQDVIPQENIRTWQGVSPVSMMDSSNNQRREVAELIRETFLASLRPDILIVTSLFEGGMDDAVGSVGKLHNIPTAVILYDLIPLIYNEIYLPDDDHRRWYFDKIASLKRSDMVLAISQSTGSEISSVLDYPSENVCNISGAADEKFVPLPPDCSEISKTIRRFGIAKPYLLYTGATDQRKNHMGLIAAYAQLPSHIRKSHRLVLGGRMPREHRAAFKRCVLESGLRAKEVMFTEDITDQELLHLYNGCKLFVFPSWHEGLGLPALEAMQCGKAVIGGNRSSIPEVIGRADALFDPNDPREIANTMLRALTDDLWRAELEAHGLRQAARFNWQTSAYRALEFIEKWYQTQCHSGVERNLCGPGVSPLTELLVELRRRLATSSDHDLVYRYFEAEFAGVHGDRSASGSAWPAQLRRLWRRRNGAAPAKTRRLTQLSIAPSLIHNGRAVLASCLSQNFPPPIRARQLLIDISELVTRDAKSGIQRVVRSLLREWMTNPRPGWHMEPVYATADSNGYIYARKFIHEMFPSDHEALPDQPAEAWEGDVFLGLDLQPRITPIQTDFLHAWRRRGVAVHHVVYDLLPIQYPQFFGKGADSNHRRWLESIIQFDGAMCISKAVADDLAVWLETHDQSRLRPFRIGWFHLGCDLERSQPTRGIPVDAQDILARMGTRPTFLMVGTLEPRKCHHQVVEAFENLWKNGVDVNLVIVGKPGWLVRPLLARMRKIAGRNERLMVIEDASDEFLEMLYRSSSALIAASIGEGFGLPLIEAAYRGMPLIVRDIPVFREVVNEHAFFFPNDSMASTVAQAVRDWLELFWKNCHPRPCGLDMLTWKESANSLFALVSEPKADPPLPKSNNLR
jgi:glycosyltransferase involved in cell wall biosynthesis